MALVFRAWPSVCNRLGEMLRNRVVVLMAAQISAAAGGFTMNILSTHALPVSARGEMAFFIQLAYAVQSVVLLGLDRSYLVGFPAQHGWSVSRSFVRSSLPAFAVLVAAAMGSAVLFSDDSMSWMWLSIALMFACSGLFGIILRVSYILGESGSRELYLGSAVGVQAVLIASALVLLGTETVDVAAWIAIYPLSGMVVVLAAGLLVLRAGGEQASSRARRVLALEGLRLFPLVFFTVLLQKADRLLLPILAGTAELGRYAFVATMMEIPYWPVSQWIDTQMLAWRKRSIGGSGKFPTKILLRVLLFSASVSAVIGLSAYLYIVSMLPSGYGSAIHLILPLGLAGVLKSLSRVLTSQLVAASKHGAATFVEFVSLGTAVSGFFVLTPAWGALGTALSLVVGALASLGLAVGLYLKLRPETTNRLP